MLTKKFKVAFFMALDQGGTAFNNFVKAHPVRCMRFARQVEGKSAEEIKALRKELGV